MKNTLGLTLAFSLGFFPIFLYAEVGFIGENPGLSFYSTIDSGNYTIQTKTLKLRLAETPTLEQFGKNCISEEGVLQGIPTDTNMLDDVENLDYASLTDALREKNTLSTETFQNLTLCLANRYRDLKSRNERENNTRINLSSLGLYMDGDTGNSDYDILSDIEKINSLIFSEALKYGGATNKSSKNFAEILAGKIPPPLFTSSVSLSGVLGNSGVLTNTGNSGQNSGTNTGSSNTPGSVSLGSLIGPSCTNSGSLVSIADLTSDPYFTTELQTILTSGTMGSPIGNGYTQGNSNNTTPTILSGTGVSGQNTSKDASSDFFHKMPCTSIFCIKVTMVGGSENTLGGGKNISIEGILDKHHKILEPISESALRDEKMTNNSFSLPFFNLKLPKTIAGLRVYLTNSPQTTRRDKRDETPDKKKEYLDRVRRCAQVSAGLSTDAKRANTLLGGGYLPTQTPTTENMGNRSTALGPQESTELARYAGCAESLVSGGRTVYYDSFSTDLTELQAFTNDMMKSIDEMMSLGKILNNKPVK